ncbi:MAG: hypothetical protein CMI61_06935 [Parvibaculum sp.]|nr:hypothetical protein [Parvibaculum sp.]
MLTGLTDTFGGRSQTLENELKKMRQVCLEDLKREAVRVGANGIVATQFHYQQISGKGTSMLMLVLSGTAVALEKEPAQ